MNNYYIHESDKEVSVRDAMHEIVIDFETALKLGKEVESLLLLDALDKSEEKEPDVTGMFGKGTDDLFDKLKIK